MAQLYSFQGYEKGNMARAMGISLPISFKHSIEICNFIRNREMIRAKKLLSEVIDGKRAIPFRRFTMHLAHKRKIGPGRYPKKASMEILDLLNQVEANAQFKGLNTSSLVIVHISANRGATVTHSGRKRSRRAKRANIEIVVREKSAENKKENVAKVKLKKKEVKDN